MVLRDWVRFWLVDCRLLTAAVKRFWMAPNWLWNWLTVASAASPEEIVLLAPVTVRTFWLARVLVPSEMVPSVWPIKPTSAPPPTAMSLLADKVTWPKLTWPAPAMPPEMLVAIPVPATTPRVPDATVCETSMLLPSAAVSVNLPPATEAVTLPSSVENRLICVATSFTVNVVPAATLFVPPKMATPFMLRLYVDAPAAEELTFENAVDRKSVV